MEKKNKENIPKDNTDSQMNFDLIEIINNIQEGNSTKEKYKRSNSFNCSNILLSKKSINKNKDEKNTFNLISLLKSKQIIKDKYSSKNKSEEKSVKDNKSSTNRNNNILKANFNKSVGKGSYITSLSYKTAVYRNYIPKSELFRLNMKEKHSTLTRKEINNKLDYIFTKSVKAKDNANKNQIYYYIFDKEKSNKEMNQKKIESNIYTDNDEEFDELKNLNNKINDNINENNLIKYFENKNLFNDNNEKNDDSENDFSMKNIYQNNLNVGNVNDEIKEKDNNKIDFNSNLFNTQEKGYKFIENNIFKEILNESMEYNNNKNNNNNELWPGKNINEINNDKSKNPTNNIIFNNFINNSYYFQNQPNYIINNNNNNNFNMIPQTTYFYQSIPIFFPYSNNYNNRMNQSNFQNFNYFSSPYNSNINSYINKLKNKDDYSLARDAIKLSKTQFGCQLLQEKSLNDNKFVNEILFPEIKNNLLEICCDLCGNCLIQTILDILTPKNLDLFLNQTKYSFYDICLTESGSRVIQKLLENIYYIPYLLNKFVFNLTNKNIEILFESPYGNHVLQKYISIIRQKEYTNFIYNYIFNNFVNIVKQKHGVCVIQRCLSEGDEEERKKIYHHILINLETIIKDNYGNYILQFIFTKFEKRIFEEILPIIQKIEENIVDYCKCKNSSSVIEKCFEKGDPKISEHLIKYILDNHSNCIRDIIFNPYGYYIIKKSMNIPSKKVKENIMKVIIKNIDKLKETNNGKKIIENFSSSYQEFNYLLSIKNNKE